MALIVLSIHLLHGRKQGLMTDPFILCLGTSNTYGNCKHGDKLFLEESETLPSLLSQRLGIHFVNLGVGGVLMTQMTDILIDALEEYDINMCKGVLVEAQQGLNSSIHVSYDNFIDWEDNLRFPKKVPLEKSISACRDRTGEDAPVAEHRFFFKQVGANMNDEYLEERLESAFGCSPPKQALNDLKEYTQHKLQMYNRSDHAWWDDIKQVRVMRSICKHAGIPFAWYHWYPEKTKYNRMQMWFINQYNMFSDHLFKGRPVYDLFDSHNYRCECRHINAEGVEIISNLVAQKVYEWIY